MSLLVQIGLFWLFYWLRIRKLAGRYLKADAASAMPAAIEWIGRTKNGLVISRAVGLARPVEAPFVIVRERWVHRLLKWLGIAREISLRDAALDRALYFLGDHPRAMQSAFEQPDAREALKELFALPVKAVLANRERIWCEIRREDYKKDSAYFDRHRRLLERLACLVKAMDEKPELRLGRAAAQVATVMLALQGSLLLAGIIGFLPETIDGFVTDDKAELRRLWWMTGCAAAVGWTVAIVFILGGTAWCARVLTDFLFGGVFGLFLCTVLLVREANIRLDHSEPVVERLPLREKTCEIICGHGKRSRTYPLDKANCAPELRQIELDNRIAQGNCRDPRINFFLAIRQPQRYGDHSFMSVATEAERFDSLSIGDLLRVPYHRGALGIEWHHESEIVPDR